jgi:phosphatidylserine synthase
MAKHLSLLTERSRADIVTLVGIVPLTLALYLVLKQQPELAILSATAAFFCDSIDGVIARKYGLESEFGRQLDSFMDTFIYLIFPGLFVLNFLNLNTILTVAAIAIMITCGMLRLVRFNLRHFVFHGGERYYVGLGVAFILLAVAVIFILERLFGRAMAWLAPPTLILMSFLMISEIHIKKPVLKFWYPIAAAVTGVIVAIYFKWL